MADFRRVVTALAVLALLTGFAVSANAQSAFTCAATTVPPLMRAEGLTELTGDIVLSCTGGTPTAVGTANFSVFLGNTTVTNRIVDSGTGATDALLLIDEPAAPTAIGANVIRGTWNAAAPNSLTFIGVPVVPSGTTGSRIYRITGIRANAAAVGTSASGNLSTSTVQALVTISGSTSIPVSNPLPIIGFVQQGLNFSVRNAKNDASLGSAFSIKQCVSADRTVQAATLRYTEGFNTAFKLQGSSSQNVPGSIYNTESGFTMPGVAGGLADFGTRLRATFSNIPSGVNVFVSTGQLASSTAGSTAVLISSETGAYAAATTNSGTVSAGTTVSTAQIAISGGSGVAVWEVTGATPSTLDVLDFAVAFSTSANPGGNSPAVGTTGQVSGSFAPVFTPPAGTLASKDAVIPRFVASIANTNIVTATVCRTSILFPFVTNQFGFDTGLAIANTSKDPFGTVNQAGTCALNFFGDNAPSVITSASVAAGTVYTTGASGVAPNFQGYVIAVCNFQYAHGFAFVQSSVGYNPSTAAMGYLGLIIPDNPARSSLPLGGETLTQ